MSRTSLLRPGSRKRRQSANKKRYHSGPANDATAPPGGPPGPEVYAPFGNKRHLGRAAVVARLPGQAKDKSVVVNDVPWYIHTIIPESKVVTAAMPATPLTDHQAPGAGAKVAVRLPRHGAAMSEHAPSDSTPPSVPATATATATTLASATASTTAAGAAAMAPSIAVPALETEGGSDSESVSTPRSPEICVRLPPKPKHPQQPTHAKTDSGSMYSRYETQEPPSFRPRFMQPMDAMDPTPPVPVAVPAEMYMPFSPVPMQAVPMQGTPPPPLRFAPAPMYGPGPMLMEGMQPLIVNPMIPMQPPVGYYPMFYENVNM